MLRRAKSSYWVSRKLEERENAWEVGQSASRVGDRPDILHSAYALRELTSPMNFLAKFVGFWAVQCLGMVILFLFNVESEKIKTLILSHYCLSKLRTTIPPFVVIRSLILGRGPLCEKVLRKAISWQLPGE
jgi:hypothetical protein